MKSGTAKAPLADALQFDSCIACTADGRNFNFGPTGSLLTGGGTTIR